MSDDCEEDVFVPKMRRFSTVEQKRRFSTVVEQKRRFSKNRQMISEFI
jgi:hypothetical protein